ncbi:hypothetical protein [Nocardia salmonicida]|uniref:hypothetical protein n=1 Tax=Nocardia salmonicida TaxID=53431 RepID=UPI003796E1D0
MDTPLKLKLLVLMMIPLLGRTLPAELVGAADELTDETARGTGVAPRGVKRAQQGDLEAGLPLSPSG